MKPWRNLAALVVVLLTACGVLRARQAPPPSSDALGTRVKTGHDQLERGLHDAALESFESVLKADPHNTQAREGEVQAAVAAALQAKRAGDNDGALVYLVRARKYVPDDPELLLDFGVQADEMHLYKDAEEALNRSLQLRAGDAKTIYALGHVELDEGRMPEAETHLREYLKLKPDDASAHYGLGKLLHALARNNEAEAELRRSIELQPQQTESYYELGDIALNLQRDDEAAALFHKVLSRNPKHGGALTGVGIVVYRKRDYAAAESYLQSAVQAAPDYSPAHFYHGLALERLGRKEQAEKELAEAKSLDEKQNQQRRGYVLSTPRK